MQATRSGRRNPSPISTSSPRLQTTSRPLASTVTASSSAAAPLFTTITSPASGSAARRAASVARPRARARAVSEVVLDVDVARRGDQRIASRRGQRCPTRGWCATPFPVALMTGVRLVARAGSPRSTSSMRCAGLSDPVAHTSLRRVHRVTHSRPAEAALRLGEPRVGEHRVRLRDSAARVRLHAARPYGPGTASASRMRIGGGGRESNPLDRDTRSH